MCVQIHLKMYCVNYEQSRMVASNAIQDARLTLLTNCHLDIPAFQS